MKTIYLDHAATTPVDNRVVEAMAPYWSKQFYNPSALYEPARKVKSALGLARSQVARVLGAKATEIIFTAGATEANNLALFGVAQLHPGSEIVATAIEHESILEPLARLKKLGWKLKLVPVDAKGIVSRKKLEQAITNNTVLVSVMYANNELGTVQPLTEIAKVISSKRQTRRGKLPLYLHTDAAQAPNYLPLQVSRLGIDLMTLNGSKIYGPKQTGCLYVRSGVSIEPLILGGGQERGLRSGTENIPGAVGFARALELATKQRVAEAKRLTLLRDYTIGKLEQLEGVTLNGHRRQRLPNNVNISIKGVSGETLLHHLDATGILVATGSACSANNDEPSHVLKAIGLSARLVNTSLRITMGQSTTRADIDYFLTRLKLKIGRLRG